MGEEPYPQIPPRAVKKSRLLNGWEISPSFFYSYPKLSENFETQKICKKYTKWNLGNKENTFKHRK